MPTPTPSKLKKTLMQQGFEVYRTLGDRILLADRVRDNLIMDSGVSVVSDPELAVQLVVRAQAHDFPGESEEELFDRARRLAHKSIDRGYVEVETAVVPIHDPGDSTRTLDIWHEVSFQRSVSDLAELYEELRYALAVEKTAGLHD
jgi:hypothetical protein